MPLRSMLVLLLALQSSGAAARNILLTNDDGLTSNLRALYEALHAQGHDVLVSVPCRNQSGMGGAIRSMQPIGPLASNCRSEAAVAGAPGAGAMTRPGYTRDYFYVDGTPVMALLYGVDVLAAKRWGRPPDLVLSGPNEGQNVGPVVISSGTVSIVQYAAWRGIAAIAVSAAHDTNDDVQLANPKSAAIAQLTASLMRALESAAGSAELLPRGMALNVNYPNDANGAAWRLTRIGTYSPYKSLFVENIGLTAPGKAAGLAEQHLPGLMGERRFDPETPEQRNDEGVVYRKDITVSVMQIAYDYGGSASRPAKQWVMRRLRSLGIR